MAVWLITGCSTGLGRAFADAALEAGHDVVVTARNREQVGDFADRYPDRALAVALDVTDEHQIESVIEAAETRFGRVDVLVNNAGFGFRGAIEEASNDEVRRLFDTNVFGAASMIRAVLPGMRARRSGTIVNISSIGARTAFAGSGYYAASKAAIEAISSALAKEVAPLGINVMAVEPGGFRTDFAGRSLTEAVAIIADYDETAGKRRKANDTSDGRQPGDPARAAKVLLEAVASSPVPTFLILGPDALDGYERVARYETEQIDAWRGESGSTNFS